MNKELDNFVVERTRAKSERDRFVEFEHRLRYMLCDLRAEVDLKDNYLLSDIQQSVIVFAMKDKLEDSEDDLKKIDEIFLSNMKNDFYSAIQELEEKHTDIKETALIIKLFMEDFYFNK